MDFVKLAEKISGKKMGSGSQASGVNRTISHQGSSDASSSMTQQQLRDQEQMLRDQAEMRNQENMQQMERDQQNLNNIVQQQMMNNGMF